MEDRSHPDGLSQRRRSRSSGRPSPLVISVTAVFALLGTAGLLVVNALSDSSDSEGSFAPVTLAPGVIPDGREEAPTTAPTQSTTPSSQPQVTTQPVVPTSAPLRGELVTQWEMVELWFEASVDHEWFAYPLSVTFQHPATSMELDVTGFWDGDRVWRVRFAPTLPGQWTWTSNSPDAGLSGHSGHLAVVAPTADQLASNDNYRGHLRTSADGARLERANGEPFFWLGDTAWWFNSARCPVVGTNATAGFSCADYFDDRVSKGFTVLGLEMFDINNANEGGFPFPCNAGFGRGNGNYTCLNVEHFRQLDRRMELIWERGLVSYANVSWLVGQFPNDGTSPGRAMLLGRYIMARYGWLPQVFSLTGEYQYGYDDRGVLWTVEDWNNYGTVIARDNPQGHPLTIHPSSSFEWEFAHPGAGRQSSAGEFHDSAWLDVNSIQSGHGVERLQHNPLRAAENSALTPRKPVLHSEGFYLENAHGRVPPTDPQLRWQAYVPLLNGAFGHIYGAVGIWEMYAGGTAEDYPQLLAESFVRVWWDVMEHPTSTQVGLSRVFFEDVVGEWWALVRQRDWLDTAGVDYVDGRTDPHLAVIDGGEKLVLFFGEWMPPTEAVTASDPSLAGRAWTSTWFDPRAGAVTEGGRVFADATGSLLLPDRPTAEDWALVLTEIRG